ncbi:Heat shock factor-binding protein 1 [Pseudocercospora fuligena]|uniref:Heat shock factor-binding protein 1 n=1 Tax=Pseudocercospora fuligena TaxID=685502 RepID=A0A8H6RP00_9PEZI|nr:Heat shock factor-binding protein 1 [Pseudocercospora fuligena]
MSNSDSASLSAQVNKLNLGNDTASLKSTKTGTETEPSELIAVVDDLLNQLSAKFSNVSADMLGKLDDMSKRLDALEAQIQAGNAAAAAGEDDK